MPSVVVDDVERALGDLARAVLLRLRDATTRPARRGCRVVGVTGSVGKTTTKDLLAQLSPRPARRSRRSRSFNNEIGLPLTVLRADESTRFLVLEMGASGIGPPHLPHRHRAARRRRGAHRRQRAPRGVRRHRGGRRREGGDRRRAWPRTASPCSTPTTCGSPRWPRSRPGDVVTFGTAAGATSARDGDPPRPGRPGDVHPRTAGRRPSRRRGVACGSSASTTSTTRSAAAAVALAVGLDLDEVAERLSASRTR